MNHVSQIPRLNLMDIILFTPKHPWAQTTYDGCTVYSAGHIKDLNQIINAYLAQNEAALAQALTAEGLQYGLIIETPDMILAVSDRTRSFPVFYNVDEFQISNHAQNLASNLPAQDVNEVALLPFKTAGYTLGDATLHRDIKTLEAGTYAVYLKDENSVTVTPYYTYTPVPQPADKAEMHTKLGDIVDSVIQDCITRLDGAPVWVPLSGGYDSRIVLAKLHEHGCKNLHCFSYGIKNNDEAKVASRVAHTIGVEWHMINAQPRQALKLFQAETRKTYADTVHGYTSVPSYVEYEAFHTLKNSGFADDGSYIINGQSGDFICGDHMPAVLYNQETPTQRDMMDFIIQKHFSLLPSLKTPENIAALEALIQTCLPPLNTSLDKREALIAQYESFEWRERQSKMVVNAAHIYDVFGYNWLMPLWHSDVMDFFETLPLELKHNRGLFMDYVRDYNYKGAFDIPRPEVRTWQPHQYGVILVAKAIEILRGPAAKADFYKKMAYYGHAHNQFSLFGKTMYDAHYKELRNMISLSIIDFLDDMGLDL